MEENTIKTKKSKGTKKIKKKKEKTNEIKELKYQTLEEIRNLEKLEKQRNIELHPVETTREYLEQYCTPIIQQAMISCAKIRPKNPIEYIGNYLLQRAHGK